MANGIITARGPMMVAWLLALAAAWGTSYEVHSLALSTAAQNQVYWTLERAAGLAAYELLALSVVLGLTSANGWWDRWRGRKTVAVLHELVGVLAYACIFLHLWGLRQDTSVPWTWLQLLWPRHVAYRPLASALGGLALYLGGVVILSSWLRGWLSTRVWRALHLMSYLLFISVTVHGLAAGTDTPLLWARVLYAVPCVLVLLLTGQRVRQVRRSRKGWAGA
ncbi:MAG: ferric reductase-like transmembrane domain-containing protein [Alicyclobacillus sp.]|nr:ferric reductase-like transmembrane domain-containing protein [Alicyclobacillus sp.]